MCTSRTNLKRHKWSEEEKKLIYEHKSWSYPMGSVAKEWLITLENYNIITLENFDRENAAIL